MLCLGLERGCTDEYHSDYERLGQYGYPLGDAAFLNGYLHHAMVAARLVNETMRFLNEHRYHSFCHVLQSVGCLCIPQQSLNYMAAQMMAHMVVLLQWKM